ncbi:MAG: hypothetical protein ACKESC_01050 [Candidatus Hodgkinia cicadicola]
MARRGRWAKQSCRAAVLLTAKPGRALSVDKLKALVTTRQVVRCNAIL